MTIGGRLTGGRAQAFSYFFIRAAVLHVNARSLSRTRTASTVPAYSSDGQRLRNYSLASVEQLLAQTPARCAVKRSKTGRITSVQLFPLPANSPALGGQRYSFPEQVSESGRKAWRHVPLLTPREEEAELFLQKIFRAVPLSCLDPEPDPPAPAVREIRRRRSTLVCSDTPVSLAA